MLEDLNLSTPEACRQTIAFVNDIETIISQRMREQLFVSDEQKRRAAIDTLEGLCLEYSLMWEELNNDERMGALVEETLSAICDKLYDLGGIN
tara:strand:+ start:640 stop:918 length:279 start_codon:yes stop_codon:yes gene_type:complete